MKYTVEVAGHPVEVQLRGEGAQLEASVAGGPFAKARLAPSPAPLYSLEHGERRQAVSIEADPLSPGSVRVCLGGRPPIRATAIDARAKAALAARSARAAAGPKLQRSPMPGVIVEVRAAAGQAVQPGDVLMILEAMKMQNEIQAERAGVVEAVHVAAGDTVPASEKLVSFAPDPEA